MPENVIEQALDQVADRTAIDWDALERSLNSADERRWLECVRVLEDIANFHCADGEDGEPAPDRLGVAGMLTTDAGRSAGATTVDAAQWWGRYRLDQKVGRGRVRLRLPGLGPGARARSRGEDPPQARRRDAVATGAAARGPGARQGAPFARGQRAERRVARRSDRAVHGIRARRDARRRVGSRAAERGRGDAGVPGRVPRARRGASRRVRAPGREGAQRDAREGRPDRAHGLRGRPGSQPARWSRARRGSRVRRCTWRRRCSPEKRRRPSATFTASACSCITWSPGNIRWRDRRSTGSAPRTCRDAGAC